VRFGLRDWQTAAIGQDRAAMRVEVINTGTELLLGHVLNTHLRDLSEMLFPLGLRVARQVTVPDGDAIREAMAESFGRAEIVLVTGGLGPTTDDITREIAAELLGVELHHDEAIMAAIAKRFARRGIQLTDRVGKQAMRPHEATVLANQFGTAPGLYFPAGVAKAGVPHLFLLPGPPRELVPMVQNSMIPILQALLPPSELLMRSWRVVGLGESEVEKLVGEDLVALDAELGYCARPGEVDVRVIGTQAQLEAAETIVSARWGSILPRTKSARSRRS
jgi:nicotinamide-nucleotide amidase